MLLILFFELSAKLLSYHYLIPRFQLFEEFEDFIFVELYESHLNLLIHFLQLFLALLLFEILIGGSGGSIGSF